MSMIRFLGPKAATDIADTPRRVRPIAEMHADGALRRRRSRGMIPEPGNRGESVGERVRAEA